MSNENVLAKKGVKVLLRDGKEYMVLPLTLNDLIKVWPIIMKLEENKDKLSKELLAEMLDLVAVALKGQVAKEAVGDLVDMADLKVIISAIVGLQEAPVA